MLCVFFKVIFFFKKKSPAMDILVLLTAAVQNISDL